MPLEDGEISQRMASFSEDAPEPAFGHLGFPSPSVANQGQHWNIVISRTDLVSGYFPFATLTEKSIVSFLPNSYIQTSKLFQRILEDLIPKTKPEGQYKMCLSFLDL